ncbi:MAG: PIG-L family deacetylase [Rhodobacteraceae bacterium]|jgi:LmbE family N-acetylglucosaminyl deacetylase|nr:PIG-L family deacetylase [Paracoccaceae bacterium]
MPLTAQDRIARDQATPRIVALHRALTALRSVTGFLQSGAHPDDELSAMLAALRFRDGLSLAYVCATRGDGGQNDIGAEAGEDLAALRTAEMERAADVLDMRLWWLSPGPDDPVRDFGFSKSGRDTLSRWGHARTRDRFVEVIRRERPDILCPTFLDVPGQHGHHRAMTELAHEVFAAAADPAYPSDLPPWSVAKLYLPAFSGGGNAYDDEVPPPPATITVLARDRDPVTGWPWARIGQQSRAFHRTQGMGAWVPPGAERDYPLHLAASRVGSDRDHVCDNLPRSLADIGLPAAAGAVAAAIAAFPDADAVTTSALRALELVRHGAGSVAPDHQHRVSRTAAQLSRVLYLAAGIEARARVVPDILLPGQAARIEAEVHAGTASKVGLTPALPPDWTAQDGHVTPDPATPPTDPWPMGWDPFSPALPALDVAFSAGGVAVQVRLPFEVPPLVAAPVSAQLNPAAGVVNLARRAPVTARLSDIRPPGAETAFDLPQGWGQAWNGPVVRIDPPADLAPGLVEVPLRLDGAPAATERRLAHAHTDPRLHAVPAILRLRAVAVELPEARIAYVGSGNDRAGDWLAALGADVRVLDDAALADPGLFATFDTLLVGVFAFRFRPGLAARAGSIRAWVEQGGTLVTLYHRPWDAWDPDATPPRRLEIGQPSLRWRVTDAAAAVTHLAPLHPVLTSPNAIGPDDWAGWVKERGLYFARAWDAAYVPLVEMADPDEAPHRGALLSAEVGRGRHSHVALGLHTQLDALTPGAFRLMANLVTPRG